MPNNTLRDGDNEMEKTIFEAALTQSIWAALSIALIFYILRKQEIRDKIQEEREEKYQTIINNLTEKLYLLDSLKEDIEDIKNAVIER